MHIYICIYIYICVDIDIYTVNLSFQMAHIT